MALIPTDAGVNLRTQLDSALRPAKAVAEIPSDLPELRQGQVFSARVQEVLPENTYKALVAGKSITLALPSGAKAGDTLELVVVDKTPRLVVARLANADATPAEASTPYPHATFSPAAQLIGSLLPGQGEPATKTLLNQGQPLLAAPPPLEAGSNPAAELAPALAKAVSQSGLFYEAHQAKWVAGEFPGTELLKEPQNQLHPPAAHVLAELQRPGPAAESQTFVPAERAAASSTGSANEAPAASTPVVHEALRPLVQQQLDAAASQRMAWHGEVWPGQTMDWEIRRDAPDSRPAQGEAEEQWSTQLALTMPRLGRVEARIKLGPLGVQIQLNGTSADAVAQLQQGLAQLTTALEAAGVPPLALAVRQGNAE